MPVTDSQSQQQLESKRAFNVHAHFQPQFRSSSPLSPLQTLPSGKNKDLTASSVDLKKLWSSKAGPLPPCGCTSRKIELQNVPEQHLSQILDLAKSAGELELKPIVQFHMLTFQYFDKKSAIKLAELLSAFPNVQIVYRPLDNFEAVSVDIPWGGILDQSLLGQILGQYGEIMEVKIEPNHPVSPERIVFMYSDSRTASKLENLTLKVGHSSVITQVLTIQHSQVCSKAGSLPSTPLYDSPSARSVTSTPSSFYSPGTEPGFLSAVYPEWGQSNVRLNSDSPYLKPLENVPLRPLSITELQDPLDVLHRFTQTPQLGVTSPIGSQIGNKPLSQNQSQSQNQNQSSPNPLSSGSKGTPSNSASSSTNQSQIESSQAQLHQLKPNRSSPATQSSLQTKSKSRWTRKAPAYPVSTEINLDAIEKGIEKRTTVMVCNIPNKLEFDDFKRFVDETNAKTYEFLYLRFDFSNRCNVGYAFVSFTNPRHLKLFVEKRTGMKWNSQNYNSEKVIDIKFARIQGRESLIRKFRSSPVMSQDPAFRPRFYATKGPLAGKEIQFGGLP